MTIWKNWQLMKTLAILYYNGAMRNIFDQYSQPENKLTHALATCLHEDSRLLKRFVKWITGDIPRGTLHVVEQQLPGEAQLEENEVDAKGLPDLWIYNDKGWALLIENKVADSLRADQLIRHHRTAINRDFQDIHVLGIDVLPPKKRMPNFVTFRLWSEIYSWLSKEVEHSDWAARCKKFLEIAESRWPAEGYLKEGTLTTFTGIPFDQNNPYNYLEAKRVIRLLMTELKTSKRLQKLANIDTALPGRPSITGKSATSVWDFLRLKDSKGTDDFTAYPHFTISMRRDEVRVVVAIPNSIKSSFRKNLFGNGIDNFEETIEQVFIQFKKIMELEPDCAPKIEVVQRHFKSQRAVPSIDADLCFDLRTVFPEKNGRVKYQRCWLEACHESVKSKKANTQLAIGIFFPYNCNSVNSAKLIPLIEETWIACSPLIRAAID